MKPHLISELNRTLTAGALQLLLLTRFAMLVLLTPIFFLLNFRGLILSILCLIYHHTPLTTMVMQPITEVFLIIWYRFCCYPIFQVSLRKFLILTTSDCLLLNDISLPTQTKPDFTGDFSR